VRACFSRIHDVLAAVSFAAGHTPGRARDRD
jgi:hypothetical protein